MPMKLQTILFVFTFLFASCTEYADKSKMLGQWELRKNTTSRGILIDKNTCELNLSNSNISNDQLIGKWSNKKFWYSENQCWLKIEKIDLVATIEFFESGKFIRRDTILQTGKELIQQGSYSLRKDEGITRIYFEYNDLGYTTFKNRDTLYFNALQVMGLDNDLLLGQISPKMDGSFDKPKVILEFQKITTR